MDEIGVDYEYGALREVILGLPIMRYPDAEQAEWVAKGLDVLPDSEGEKVRARSGKHSRRDLDKYEQMEAENDELLEVLDRFDVKVHRPSEITDEQVAANYGEEWLINGYIQSFSRDSIFVVGEDAIALEGGDLLALGKTVLAGDLAQPDGRIERSRRRVAAGCAQAAGLRDRARADRRELPPSRRRSLPRTTFSASTTTRTAAPCRRVSKRTASPCTGSASATTPRTAAASAARPTRWCAGSKADRSRHRRRPGSNRENRDTLRNEREVKAGASGRSR